MTVLIMCQGEQRRLASLGYPKHLIPIATDHNMRPQTILARTVRLVAELVADDIIVVGLPAHAEAVRIIGARLHTLQDPGYCVLDGILGTSSLWSRGEPTTVLLGDVVFSRHAIDAIFCDRKRLRFAGTSEITTSTGELFAVTWSDHEEMQRLLASSPCRVNGREPRPIKYPKQQGGHLRRLLWWAMVMRRLKAQASRTWAPELFIPIDDFTDDVDTEDDLGNLGELRSAIALETSMIGA